MFKIYGLIQFSTSIVEVFIRLYLVVFFTTQIGLSGEMSGIIVSSSLISSALFAPWLGNIVDSFQTKQGSLKPVITFALILMAATLALLFVPNWSHEDKFILFALSFFYQISYTLFIIPYFSFAKELIQQEDDIISLHSWRYFWGSLGAIIGVSLPYLNKTYAFYGIFMSLCCLLLGPVFLKFLKLSPKPQTQTSQPVSFMHDVRDLLGNLPFRYFLSFYILASIGLGLNQTLAVFYYKEGLGLNTSETSMLLGIYMLFFCIAIALWTIISKKIGLKKTLVIGISGTLLCITCYPFVPYRNFTLIYTLFILVGVFSSFFMLIDSYLSRIIDYHSYQTGRKKSNFIFGVWKIADKFSRSLGIYLSGIILDMLVYHKIPNLLGLNFKETFTLGLLVFYLPAFLFLFFMRFNEKHHKIIIKNLKQKNPQLLYSEY